MCHNILRDSIIQCIRDIGNRCRSTQAQRVNPMEVTRTQYPIGQGCFHAGHIRWMDKGSSTADDFHYIYDCGSSDGSAALQDAIAACRRQTSRIDALFVSHLDADHVNGIDRLLGSVSVGTVYIPYVDSVVPTLEILKADDAGAVSASLIEVHMDPRSWFGRRGVARIVRVRSSLAAGPDEEPAPESELPPVVHFDAKTGTNVLGRRDTLPQVKTMNSGAMVITNPGHSLPWALVPHVDPAPKERLRAFHREVRSVLDLEPRQRLTAERLAGAIRDNGERKRLRKCYEQIVSHGSSHEHNHVSMSLYSGPRKFDEDSLWRGHLTMVCSDLWPAWWPHTVPLDYLRWQRLAVGWIGAGDANYLRSCTSTQARCAESSCGLATEFPTLPKTDIYFAVATSRLRLPPELPLRHTRLAQPEPLCRRRRRSFPIRTSRPSRGPESLASPVHHASGVAAHPVGTPRGIQIAVLTRLQAKDLAN